MNNNIIDKSLQTLLKSQQNWDRQTALWSRLLDLKKGELNLFKLNSEELLTLSQRADLNHKIAKDIFELICSWSILGKWEISKESILDNLFSKNLIKDEIILDFLKKHLKDYIDIAKRGDIQWKYKKSIINIITYYTTSLKVMNLIIDFDDKKLLKLLAKNENIYPEIAEKLFSLQDDEITVMLIENKSIPQWYIIWSIPDPSKKQNILPQRNKFQDAKSQWAHLEGMYAFDRKWKDLKLDTSNPKIARAIIERLS